MDFLSKWIQKLTNLNFLTSPLPNCATCLLYADDTLILLKPTRTQLLRTKLLFDIFGAISGLKVNLNKSELSVTSSTPFLTQSLAGLIQCKPMRFPLKYLGLPLSDKRLTRVDYLPYIDKIQTALMGWKASMLTIGGRLILTNAVLSAIPQYLMSMFLLPKWVLRTVDRIRRRFLWHGHRHQQNQSRGLYMVNWRLATTPRYLGGLGVRDIQTANHSLLMKWMWQWHDPNGAWWKAATAMLQPAQKPWNDANGTPFWKGIKHIDPIFACSVTHRIGSGNKTSFWHDNWQDGPLKFRFPTLYSETPDKNISVAQCTDAHGWHLQPSTLSHAAQIEKDRLLSLLLQMDTPQSDVPDLVVWNRHPSTFSTSTAYKFISNNPRPSSLLKHIWEIKAPLRVQIFAWLLLSDRLTTIDNLSR